MTHSRRAVVVVHAMESEPASRKDQLLLTVAPHHVLGGAVLAALAVGADPVQMCRPRSAPSSTGNCARLWTNDTSLARRDLAPAGLPRPGRVCSWRFPTRSAG
ncbi:hypothetical protein [Actinacidiphila sp. bgisy160]|uniref:hypothetical protein n=1 Tax=Actinacidiphila sp. bgisy160 TaxID=3413796 RepID=UPI003D71AAB5